jgi:tetratricopeptide (TPR) repeat protein
MTARYWRTLIRATAVVLVASNGRAEVLDDAKTQYAAAAFENALAILGRLAPAESNTPDVLTYRALCLRALGREDEAQTIAETLVATAPAFIPATGDEISPRFVTLLANTRRRLLPDITKRLFAEAREQFHANNEAAAIQRFEQVLALADDSVWSDRPEAADLRTLASGFLDLLHPPRAGGSLTAPAAPTATPVVAASPAVTAAARGVKVSAALIPAIVLAQPMPKWRPPDAVSAQRHFTGAVRVRIGVDGHVVRATMEIPTHPDYDRLLVEAARSWIYKAATRNGEPVEVEKLVTFSLKTN